MIQTDENTPDIFAAATQGGTLPPAPKSELLDTLKIIKDTLKI